MQLLFPVAFRRLLNEIESTEPLIQLYDLGIQYDVTTQASLETRRYAKNNEPITYLGNTYAPIPLEIGDVSEGSTSSPATNVTATLGNIDSTIADLCEQFWIPVVSEQRLWVVTMYLVKPSDPDLTPVATGLRFQVDGISVNYASARFTLSQLNPAQTLQTPGRMYSRRHGFPIPGRP